MYKEIEFAKAEDGVPLKVGYVIRKNICVYSALQAARHGDTKTNARRIKEVIEEDNPNLNFSEMRFFDFQTVTSYGPIRGLTGDDFLFEEHILETDGEETWKTTLCPGDISYIFRDLFPGSSPTQKGLPNKVPSDTEPKQKMAQTIVFNR